jgi:hypothetical protein
MFIDGAMCDVFPASSLEKPKGAVAWVAFEVALASVCIPLGREGKVGYVLLH